MTLFEHNKTVYYYNEETDILTKQKQNFWNKLAWSFPPTACLFAVTFGPIIYDYPECKWTPELRIAYNDELEGIKSRKKQEEEEYERRKKEDEEYERTKHLIPPHLRSVRHGLGGYAFSN